MEVAFKYGRLMSHANRRNVDAEATLIGPFMVIASLLAYLAASGALFTDFPFKVVWSAFVGFSVLGTTLSLLFSGLALVYFSRPKRLRNVLWLPFVYCYWCLQGFISLYAALLIAFRRPKVWLKTEKTGFVTSSESVLKREN